MAYPRLLFFHLKTLRPSQHHQTAALRRLSFAIPEEAAAERRARKLRLGIDTPPLSSLLNHPPHRLPSKASNPNIPKLPDPVTALSGNRVSLHNRILTLIRADDLEEASLLVRHSIYSNCRPTVFTCNAVLSALLSRHRHSDLFSLHRFIIQAGVAPTVVTHNLLLQAYSDSGKIDTALQHYGLFIKDSPLTPSPSTYRILVKTLVSAFRLEEAVKLKDDMTTTKGCCPPDPAVYNLLMSGFIQIGDPDRVLALFEELKGKLGESKVLDGVVYGNLMNAYFRKGMEKEAMECYNDMVVEGSKVRFDAASYNSVLDSLSKNGEFDEALHLFGRMMGEHSPPRRLTLNLGSFNVMVNGFCAAGKFHEAIEVFRKMGEKKCNPDTASYNNLIGHLGKIQMVTEAEELYSEMEEKIIKSDEFTHILLMEACFGVNRIDDAIGYFNKMVELGLRPNTVAYNKLIAGLLNVGKLDEGKGFFNQMVDNEVKRNDSSYEMLLQAFCEARRLDDALMIIRVILMDEGVVWRPEMKELVEVALRREGREEELARLHEDVEREKAEALARAAEEKARAEALAREEAERKKAEAAAKEAAAARASAAAIEAILGRRDLLGSKEEGREGAHVLGANVFGGVALDKVIGNNGLSESTKDGDEGAADGGVLEEVRSE